MCYNMCEYTLFLNYAHPDEKKKKACFTHMSDTRFFNTSSIKFQ